MTDAMTAVIDFAIAAYTRLDPGQIDFELAVLRERAILMVEREAERAFDETLEAAA
jgi:hypothetical protein